MARSSTENTLTVVHEVGSRLAEPADLRVGEVEIDGVLYHVVSHPLDAPPPRANLTSAEREIAERILAGWSQVAIAAARGTSPRTVAKQVELLYRKVGVQSRAELMARAEVVLGVEADPSS